MTVIALNGEAKAVTNLQPSSHLLALRGLVGQAFGVPPAQVQLSLGARVFTTAENNRTLRALGVGEGSELTFVRQSCMEVVAGTRVELCMSGTKAVHGVYMCSPRQLGYRRATQCHGDGPLVLRQEGAGPHYWIAWWKESRHWAAGWYVEDECGYACYYHPSESATQLPLGSWVVYTQEWSKPGALPAPDIRLVEITA